MGVQWEIDFDYARFEQLLHTASLEAFTDIQAKHPNQTFYNFSLYSTPLFTYAEPICNTEEGLTNVANRYLSKYNKQKPNHDVILEDIKMSLRCGSLGDFVYYSNEIYQEIFQPVNRLLSDFEEQIAKLDNNNRQYISDKGCWEIQKILIGKIEAIELKVMTQLDSRHIFEKTNPRNNVTLGLRFRDQSEKEIARYASILNPPDVYEKFIAELEQGYIIGKVIFDKVYRD